MKTSLNGDGVFTDLEQTLSLISSIIFIRDKIRRLGSNRSNHRLIIEVAYINKGVYAT